VILGVEGAFRGGRRRREQLTKVRVALGAVEHDDLLVCDAGRGGRWQRLAAERRNREEHPRPRGAQLVLDVFGRREGCHGRHGAAGAENRVEDRDERRDVRGVQRDDVAGSNPPLGEPASDRIDLCLQLAVGRRVAGRAVDDRDAARILFIQVNEDRLVERFRRDLDIVVGARKDHEDSSPRQRRRW